MALPEKRTSASRLPGILSAEARRYGFHVDPDRAAFNANMRAVKSDVSGLARLEEKTLRERKSLCESAFESLREARLHIRRDRDTDIRSMAATELVAVRRQLAGLCRRGKK